MGRDQPLAYSITSLIRANPVVFRTARAAYLLVRPPAQRALYALRHILPARLQIFAVRGRAQSFMALIAPDRSFLYVAVQKVGNSTIKRRLWKLYGVDVEDDGALFTVHADTGPLLGLHNFAGRDLRDLLRGPGTFRFTFVRNPYSRLVSAYRDKMLNLNGNHTVRKFNHDLPFPPDYVPSFDEFVRAATARPDEGCDWHWMSQHRATMCDIIDYDFIGRIETFEEDFAKVLDAIAVDPARLAGVRSLNRYRPEEEAASGPFYDQALADIVWRRYRRDFERFGYDRESWRDWA